MASTTLVGAKISEGPVSDAKKVRILEGICQDFEASLSFIYEGVSRISRSNDRLTGTLPACENGVEATQPPAHCEVARLHELVARSRMISELLRGEANRLDEI